jgi:hypothetical protein
VVCVVLAVVFVVFAVAVAAGSAGAQEAETCAVDGDVDFVIAVNAPSQLNPGVATIAEPGEFGALTMHTPIEFVAWSGISGEFDVWGDFDAALGVTTYTWHIETSLLNTLGEQWAFDATAIAPAGASGSLHVSSSDVALTPTNEFRVTGTVTGSVTPCSGSLADTGSSSTLLVVGVFAVAAGIVLRAIGRNRCAFR